MTLRPAADGRRRAVVPRLPRRASRTPVSTRSLVTRLPNIRYLTGFTGSAAVLLVAPDELLFVTDGRYQRAGAEQLAAPASTPASRSRRRGAAQREVARQPRSTRAARLGLEADGVTWAQQRTYARVVRRRRAGPDRRPRRGAAAGEGRRRGRPDRRRVPRSPTTRSPTLLADAAATAPDRARVRASQLDTEMRRRGASGNSFETIVASGPNGAKPHARPTDRADRPRRARRARLRLHGRRLLLRHDAHGQRRRPRSRRSAGCSTSSPRASGPAATRCAAGVDCARRSTRRAATSSTPPAGARRSRTAPATASASRSTRRRGSPRPPLLPWRRCTS